MKGTKFLSSKAILGIVTAVAVVVTVAGSFAAWDTLNATASTTTGGQIRQSITLSKTDIDTFSSDNTLGAIPVATGTATFSAPNLSGTKKLVIKPTVTISDAVDGTYTTLNSSNYTLAIKKGEGESSPVTDTYTDSSFEAAGGTYTITVVPENGDTAKTAMDGKYIKVDLVGQLGN